MVNYTKWYIDKFSIRMIKQAVPNSKLPPLQKKRTLSILLELLGLNVKLLWKWVQIGKCKLSISYSALSMMCCSPWGHKESDTIEGLKWIELIVHWVPSPENWSRHNFFFSIYTRNNRKSFSDHIEVFSNVQQADVGSLNVITLFEVISLVAHLVKNLPAMQETKVWFLGWEDPLEWEMATHFSILAWRIPWTEELGGLQSMGSQESDTTE